MNEIWRKRRNNYQKMLLKYLKYVFNDHFVIAFLFLVGAFGLSYSNFLKSLSIQDNIWWAKPLVIVILVVSLHTNQLATFLHEADRVFLLPQEQAMQAYVKNSLAYSRIVMTVVQLTVFLLLTPFLLFAAKMSSLNVVFLLGLQMLLLYLLTNAQAASLFLPHKQERRYQLIILWLLPVLLLLSGVYLPGYLALLVAAILVGWLTKRNQRELNGQLFDWRFAIDWEKTRTTRLYRFFNMFTDVSSVYPRPKRRQYLDKFLPHISAKAEGFFKYTFWRAFIRSGQYSSLYLRLTFLGMLILFFVTNYWLAVVFAVLFIYMIGFQLLPLYVVYDEVVFMHTYPINIQKKFIAFSKVLFFLLLLSALMFAIPMFVHFHEPIKAITTVGLLVLESALIARIYSKGRLKKVA